VALPRTLAPTEVDLATALRLLALPRELGRHPETGEAIVAGIGRFGPYIKHGAAFKSLGADDDVLTIGLNRAVVLLAESATARRPGPQLLRDLGAHPGGGAVGLYRGRYGPYVSHGGVIASLPKSADPETFSLADALPLLAGRRPKTRTRPGKTRKSAAAKAPAQKAVKKAVKKAGAAPAKRKTAARGPAKKPGARAKAPPG
jgi:DNA topoisomerase-1